MVNLTISDSAGAQAILDAVRKRWPWVKHLFADAAYDRLKRPCHVVESISRKACASESFKLPRLPRATCSSPRREACDAFELRPDGVGR